MPAWKHNEVKLNGTLVYYVYLTQHKGFTAITSTGTNLSDSFSFIQCNTVKPLQTAAAYQTPSRCLKAKQSYQGDSHSTWKCISKV